MCPECWLLLAKDCEGPFLENLKMANGACDLDRLLSCLNIMEAYDVAQS